jgi:hypothetical protein
MPSLLDVLFGRGTPMATQNGEITGPIGEPQGGLLGGLRNSSGALMGFGMGMLGGANQQEGFQSGMVGMQRGVLTDRQRKAMQEAQMEKLRMQAARKGLAEKYGMDPALADVPGVQDAVLKEKLTPQDPMDAQIKRARLEALQREAKGGNERFGLNVIWGQDENGNTVPLQPGDQGTLKPLTLPNGIKVASGIEKIDGGTKWILRDKRTGNYIGEEPKDIAGAAAEKARGETVGQTAASLPDTMDAATQMLTNIQEIRNHPGKKWGTGMTSVANAIPGTEQFGFQQRVEQLKGGAYLEAIQKMRGLGALSEAEGRAATSALTRLNSGANVKEFDAALSELETIVKRGAERAQRKAAGNLAPRPGSAPSQGGDPLSAADAIVGIR